MSLILVELMLILYAVDSRAEITANCDEDVSLPCTGVNTSDFFSLMWYKVSSDRKEGIIMKRRNRKEPEVYSAAPPAVLGEHFSLTLLRVTPESTGSYECAVSSRLGGQNLNPRVDLVVHECVTQPSVTQPSVTQPSVTQPSVTQAGTTNRSEELQRDEGEELPLAWTLLGCGALGLVKVLLSVIGVQVLRVVCPSRRWAGLHRDGC